MDAVGLIASWGNQLALKSFYEDGKLDIVNATRDQVYLMAGWVKSFPTNKLPKGLVNIEASAFNGETGKAFPLGSQQINNV